MTHVLKQETIHSPNTTRPDMVMSLQITTQTLNYHMTKQSQMQTGNCFAIEKAFTLIELLVVVAITSILMSLLLPSLRNARESARSIVCMSNLKQIHAALGTYAADNNGLFPGTGEWPWGPQYWRYLDSYLGTESATWDNGIGWVKHHRVLQCPSEKGFDYATLGRDTTGYWPVGQPIKMWQMGWQPTSYMVNYSMIYNYNGNVTRAILGYCSTDMTGMSPSSTRGSVSEVPMLMDGGVWSFGWGPCHFAEVSLDSPVYWQWVNFPVGCAGYFSYAFRHAGGRANVLYMDGHIGSVLPYSVTGVATKGWKYP